MGPFLGGLSTREHVVKQVAHGALQMISSSEWPAGSPLPIGLEEER